MNKFLLIFLFTCFSTSSAFSQDTNYYKCSNCSNPLFLKGEIIKEKKKNYIVKYNKAQNPLRKNNKIKDVHCAYCDSHTGYCDKEGEVKILPHAVHLENGSYSCSVCNKPLHLEKDLKEKTEDAYTFTVINNKEIQIVNRSYIVNGKIVYCSFCYQELGKMYRKKDLNIKKEKVITP